MTSYLKPREIIFDFLKGFAIFMVIWQHCINLMGYQMEFLNTVPGKLITMVNMPLFMFIVGYFSKSAIADSMKNTFIKKWHSLCIPMLIYCGIQLILSLCLGLRAFPVNIAGGVNCL